MLTVSTQTGVLLQKLTFGISVKGHAREQQLTEQAATQTAQAQNPFTTEESLLLLLCF